ncbi:MAG: hypothetical protein P4L99_17075 [Chthoniobacter sp.]|nr:hypothetical protein [Chthoniobacter sp.]
MKNTLIKAIQDKSVLNFTYDNHSRTAEPHAVGNSTAGNDVLRCYQTAGTSSEGKVPDWKLMLLSDIRNLTVGPATFLAPRPGYKTGDKGMSVIYAQL